MQPVLELVGAFCGAIPLEGGLVAGLFLAGLAGAPLHCGPMCGGFVLGQVADRMADVPARSLCEWRRVRTAALFPYHAGRILTYTGLGALAGIGGSLSSRLPWASTALLILAAGLFGLMAWRRWSSRVGAFAPRARHANGALPRRPAGMVRWLASLPQWRTGLRLGLLLGFLPCGFLYAALAAAASSQDGLAGALGMAAFGIGTVPALLIVGLIGHAADRRWHAAIASVAPFILVVNAALLTLLAIRGLLA